MPPPDSLVLQQLDRLDGSSPEFRDQLCNILYGKEYVQCTRDLQDDDLMWLVDYLDRVCRHVALPTPRSSQRRFSVISIPPLSLPESASASSEAYAVPRGYSQHRTSFRLTSLILVPSRSPREAMVICTREPLVVRGFASNVFGFMRTHKSTEKFVLGCRFPCPL